jgi:hypothetical protein|tara:strand:+ start:194 stop:712 length:519 start_codon:yes stop_codon:yes gene_type:complete
MCSEGWCYRRGYITLNETDIAESARKTDTVAKLHDFQYGSIRIGDLYAMIEVDRVAMSHMFGDDIARVPDRFPLGHIQISKILSLFIQDIVVVKEMKVIDGHGYPQCSGLKRAAGGLGRLAPVPVEIGLDRTYIMSHSLNRFFKRRSAGAQAMRPILGVGCAFATDMLHVSR